MTQELEYEIVEELLSVPSFNLQRVQQANNQRHLLKQFAKLSPSAQQALRLSNSLSRQQSWPHVLTPSEIFKHGEQIKVVYDDMAATSLRQYILQQAPLSLTDFNLLAVSLVKMLKEIHQSGWVVRNLCPENIVVCSTTGHCFLTDLLTATSINKKEPLLLSQNEFYDVRYISPEQTGRLNRETDYRSDYYSLGCIFFELLTGQNLFPHTSFNEYVYSIVTMLPQAPSLLNSSLPKSIDAVVTKLLAKSPDERYQTADGIIADIEQCSQAVETFILAKADHRPKLFITEKLIGRNEELQILKNAASLAVKGNKQVIYILGHSGIGKTRLVAELQQDVLNRNFRMVSAKFDVLQRDTPYSALNSAVKELVHQLLKEDEEQLSYWKERLLKFLNDNGQLIIDQVPELEQIIGKQPAVNDLPPEEAQSRFLQTCIGFVKCFTTEEHSLIIFIDDLQWADIASIKLIEMVILDSAIKSLLFIGAYRDNEVSLSHPLSISLQKQQQWLAIKEIELTPLVKEHLDMLVTSSLKNPVEESSDFVDHIHRKTSGNTFFVIQLLISLYESKKLQLNNEGFWEWNSKALDETSPEQNVAQLLIQRLSNLGDTLKNSLACAACLGDVFDLRTTAHLLQTPLQKLAKDLANLINEGFIISLDDHLDFFLKTNPEDALSLQLNTRLKFAHDHVRQAALSLLHEKEIARLNLEAGKYKLRFLSESELQNDIFYLATNFNIGAELITNAEDLANLVDINFKAGMRAKNASAYEGAISYFAAGKKHLRFEKDYQSTYNFYIEAAFCKLLTGQYEEAEQELDLLFEKATSRLDKLNVLFLKVYLYTMQDKKIKAVETGRHGYAMYGLVMPSHKPLIMLALLKDLVTVNFKLKDKKIDTLIDRPIITNKEIERFLEFILTVAPALYQYDQNLFALNTLKMVLYSLKYGNNGIASFGYLGYGMIISQLFGNYQKGQKLATVAIELNNRLAYTSLKWKILLSHYNFVTHWTQPVRPGLDKIIEVENGAYANGDPIFAGYAIFIYHQKKFALGYRLEGLQKSFEEYLKLADSRHDVETNRFLQPYYHAILCLRGIETNTLLLGESFDAPKKLEQYIADSTLSIAADTYIAYISTLFLFGHFEEAYNQYIKATPYMEFIQQRYEFAEYHFYGALICAKAGEMKMISIRKAKNKIKKHLGKLKLWQQNCPDNFEPQYLLVSAEYQRISKKNTEATQLFEKAIASAEKFLFVNYKALACEMAGRNAFSSGNILIAKTYLETARQAYLEWGAEAKVKQVEKEFNSLFPQSLLRKQGDGNLSLETMDIASVLQMAQSVKSENDIDHLIEQLMKSVVQVTDADRAFLLIYTHSDLVLKATFADGKVSAVTAYPDGSQLPLTLIRHAVQLKEPLIIKNPSRSPDYSAHPYFTNHTPQSVLCFPLFKQATLFGMMYFENQVNEECFSADRITTLNLVAQQIVVVLDSAHLYKNLESIVAERTSELTARMDRSDALLQNVLPKEAIEDLKKTGKTKAQKFDDVTVLMADIKGFTIISEKLTPEELIQKIDLYFRAFDKITSRHGLEKIKTIGDAYMAAGGLGSDPEEAVKATIAAALQMQEFMNEQQSAEGNADISLRIGIHTGTVIAGVVGSKKFQYDIWGDTVNVAARMEQTSEPGRVNVSQRTRDMAKESFHFIYRGKIDAKNKGELDMYFAEKRLE